MTGDLPAAAVRLMSALPVRTHEQRPSDTQRTWRQINTAPREVVIEGVRFASVNEAARKLHRADRTIRRWLLDGKGATLASGKGTKGGNNRKRIRVNGREYDSIGAARKALGCCIHSLYAMLKDGRARYVSETDQRMVNLGAAHRRYRRG